MVRLLETFNCHLSGTVRIKPELMANSTMDGGLAPDANTYSGPQCPHARCKPATCYKVENLGPVGSAKGAVLGNTTVQIIDGCPAGSAWNYW